MSVIATQLERDLAELATFGADPGGGITRRAFSPAASEAEAWLADRMRAAGLTVRTDAAGNLIGRIGPPGPAVVTGSHIDTVVRGGALDGTVGVLAGIECARLLVADGDELDRALEVIAFADEEGRFHGHLGSLAMAGALDASRLDGLVDDEGVSLVDALGNAGLTIADLPRAVRDPAELHAYVELHVEQGPLLESVGVPIGIVGAICGVRRCIYRFTGVANHAGATPQNLRQDAMLAAARFMSEAEELVLEADHRGPRLTFGVLHASPQVDCVIPDDVRVTVELRSADAAELEVLDVALTAVASRVASERDVGVKRHEYHRLEPVTLNARLASIVQASCDRRGLATAAVVSGAGHDAQSLAPLTETVMIFVPSRGGRSHSPEEATDGPELAAGALVLLDVLRQLLREPVGRGA